VSSMITCIMITQPSRLHLARMAIGDFARQTIVDAELLVVHTGDEAFEAALLASLDEGVRCRVRLHRAESRLRLGALRNIATAVAAGDFVCQWDDDDRYHPLRLELQHDALRAQAADFCFLTDQLHWFPQRRELYWDDWSREAYPLDFIQGTLFGRRSLMPVYQEIARGEDTGLAMDILRARHRIARLGDQGWCYVYVYHGGNVFSADHHVAISASKCYSGARLLVREALLRERLAEYAPRLGALRMPWTGGGLAFD
jgi:glycosyltransferase involved in cell wall biosynthesis